MPGAVSLFVYETSKISKYKKKITVFGSTDLKKKFAIKYKNIISKKNILRSHKQSCCKKIYRFRKKKINLQLLKFIADQVTLKF